MSINSSFFMSDFNFDVTVKSLLLGFSRKENVKVTGCTNVVVFGTTEASSQAYVSNMLKGTIPENIQCAGVDTNHAHYRGKGFSGYIVMLPELRYVGNEHYDKIIDTFEVLSTANQGKMGTGEYKDLEILFARRDIEASFFGSLFEKWKTEQENHGWYFYGEHKEFSRAHNHFEIDKFSSHYLGFGDDADYGDADKTLRIAPPIVLSWTKVAALLLGKENTHVSRQMMHPVRFGPEFNALTPHAISTAILKFTVNDPASIAMGQQRVVCVHDSLARSIFEERMRPTLAIGTQYAYASASETEKSTEVVVTLDELAE